MASEPSSGQIPNANLLQGSQAVSLVSSPSAGNVLPSAGNKVPPVTVAAATSSTDSHTSAPRSTDPQTLVNLLNRNLNDSGRPDQFRLDPASASLIQQVNPANGEVVGEFSVEEFPDLARSVGATGGIVDSRA